MFNPVNLCKHSLSSGRMCRQVALKGEHICRHHRRLFNRSEAEMLHEEAMERLAAQLHSLDTPTLLRALHTKLNHIRTTVRAHPEARLALQIAIDRICQARQQTDEAERSFLRQLNDLAGNPNAINDLARALQNGKSSAINDLAQS